MNLPTDSIIVPPRQRDPQIDEHFVSSISKRLIQPIVLRQTDDGPTLVVGARRLLALKQIGIDTLIEGEHFKFLHNLSPEDAEIVELEENIKRAPMEWREYVRAIAKIHETRSKQPDWSTEKTAAELSMTSRSVDHSLYIYRRIDSPMLKDARNWNHAYSLLQIAADRATASIVTRISQAGAQPIPTQTPLPLEPTHERDTPITNPAPQPDTAPINLKPQPISPSKPVDPDAILCTSFQSWLETYSGPKFNVIHCDFPYNIEYKSYALSITSTSEDYDTKPFDDLLNAFINNVDKFCSYQAHLIFWFSMEFYEQTRTKLEAAGFSVHRHPLIWFKSDNMGIIPGRDNQYTRRVYETAFLCSRGRRPMIKSLANLYPCPTVSNSIHPSQKPESMLKHFLSMLVDHTTDVLDPTCGSGAALRAADALGANSILGLELDPEYAKRANHTTNQARQMRRIQI